MLLIKHALNLGVTVDQLNYEVTLETKGLFSKKAEISCLDSRNGSRIY